MPAKSKNLTFYVLEYTNDRPYSESIERWFAESFEELESYYEDWMGDATAISVGEWNGPLKYLGEVFEEIAEEKPEDIEEVGDKLPTNISYCKECGIFYNRKLKKCKSCKEDCIVGYDNVGYERV